ncbi:MAG: hypothetical protein ACTH6G_06780, partial [Mesonia sp.]|uniref:hypothetical protein n=2 Tax=Mesonia sp. TaxID=1960830 RepID=UPI003F943BE8
AGLPEHLWAGLPERLIWAGLPERLIWTGLPENLWTGLPNRYEREGFIQDLILITSQLFVLSRFFRNGN